MFSQSIGINRLLVTTVGLMIAQKAMSFHTFTLPMKSSFELTSSQRGFFRSSPKQKSCLFLVDQDCVDTSQQAINEATQKLINWDRQYSLQNTAASISDGKDKNNGDMSESVRVGLLDAVRILNTKAQQERSIDPATGRCMLGICSSSVEEGISILKAWVSGLELPRGLLHGADIDGVPIAFPDTGVYIKYNSGGVYTFADIRKSQMGFDALWKPGDAMLEEYDGTVRGVYFQVELSDGEFRQYLLPQHLFGSDILKQSI